MDMQLVFFIGFTLGVLFGVFVTVVAYVIVGEEKADRMVVPLSKVRKQGRKVWRRFRI